MAAFHSTLSYSKLNPGCNDQTIACSSSYSLPIRRCVLHRKVLICQAEAADNSPGQDHQKSLAGAARELMESDPATQDRLQRVKDAAALVASLQAQKADLDREITAAHHASAWEAQDQERRQAQRASERGAQADLLTAADDMEKAQAELTAALQARSKWNAAVNEGAEKLESAKAGIVAAAGGAVGSLPFVVSSSNNQPLPLLLGSLAVIAASSLLFGVTYRYAVRKDLGNRQLKGGVVGAFGLVRGLALAEAALRDSATGPLSSDALGLAAVQAGESMLSIGFAAAAMEIAFQRGFVKPFGAASSSQQ